MLKRVFSSGAMMLVLVLAACTAQAAGPEATPDTRSHGNRIGGHIELVDALRRAGATIEPAGQVEQPFFSVQGQIIRVNGLDVQVFEYADEAAQQAESDQISNSGSVIGTTMITWVDQPNFWAKGRIIVLYVGSEQPLLDLLGSVLS